jgi:hypothetical protein
MKAVFTEEYYKQQYDKFFQKYREDCDYEHDLQILTPDFSMLPEEHREKAIEVATKITAEKVAKTAEEELIKKMNMIKDIKEGRASLGYISKRQEIIAWHDLQEGFEFCCYCLAQFKQKYGIV